MMVRFQPAVFWEKSRLRFSANTDEVTIADVAALRLTTGTIIALGGLDQ